MKIRTVAAQHVREEALLRAEERGVAGAAHARTDAVHAEGPVHTAKKKKSRRQEHHGEARGEVAE